MILKRRVFGVLDKTGFPKTEVGWVAPYFSTDDHMIDQRNLHECPGFGKAARETPVRLAR
jgi:hypothetical protein